MEKVIMDIESAPMYPSPMSAKIQRNTDVTSVTPMPSTTSPPMLLGPENTLLTCQFCNATIKSAVRYTVTARTHIAAALCQLVCCCCCIPYCSNSAKNTDHYCPNCHRYLGTYKK